MNKKIFGILALLVFASCGNKEGELFSNPPAGETGITFTNTLSETEDLNILDYLYFYNGGGVAVGDINGDELPDIFFSGNQVKNRLYLNKGNMAFEDISETAGILGNSSWNTGAVMGDVNGDGLLDIYVCAVVGINGFDGYNELYINNGDNTFTEKAAEYGLDFDTYSSSAAFLDYDLDGDLDMYLLNHAVHTQESYGHADIRRKRNYQTGDKLLRNDNGKFIDVSEEAGIYGGVNGYGLGVAVADFNQDGYADIYVGNDFHEDDYYYLNNGDGTFSESLKAYFGHTTRFSMGNDVADINHDGWPDIISLDMLPEDEKVLKTSEGDDDIQTQKLRTKQFGYHYQFPRNMLYLNQQGSSYTETALQSGIAATDWSWSALFEDYDQDGHQDVFISNGVPKRPNDLDYIKFVSDEQIRIKLNNTKLVDQQALDMMPSGAVSNYIFKGSETLKFENKSGQWITKDTLFSGATALADLDLDGDLDLVANNSNSTAVVYVNKTNSKSAYLKLKFNYTSPNHLGIGTKVFSYHQGNLQYKELYTVRGFQASSEPMVHFGYGQATVVDSLRIVWPDGRFQTVKDIAVNQTLKIKPENPQPFNYGSLRPETKEVFKKVENNLGLTFHHKEDGYIDFNRQKLIPYQIADRGPAIAIGDLNNDNKPDVFFGGSKFIPSKLFVQSDSLYIEKEITAFVNDSIKEDIAAVIADFDKDGKNDLFVGSGGGDFYNEMEPLLDSYFTQNDSAFSASSTPRNFENTSVVKPCDIDQDGDLDLFIGNQAISNDFGKIPSSYLLRNDDGILSDVKLAELQQAGMITDAIWDDIDNDGQKDLIVIGEWMSPRFFKNTAGELEEITPLTGKINGLWQCIAPFDIDHDGDIDYVLGNWGTNSKFNASVKFPLKMYYSDFDENGNTETIIAIAKNGEYYPAESFDGLASQIVSLRKKFTSYNQFAGKTLDQIFEKKALKTADVLTVDELRSGYLENNNGEYTFIPFQNEMQVAPIMALLVYDFDGDNATEVLAAGNYFGVKPFHGRFDSFSGAMINGKNDVILGSKLGLDFAHKSARSLDVITLNNQPYVLATFNNEKVQVYQLINKTGE
ncbi:VCBS repeat-containing protein [Muriicola sp. Z0-33]|uniref:VCBS repeat-containing protein n=1 Tax=Muriicola sp. Z0-33 TaxID=2816957 RepID=UPI0022389DCC|nr:VCBS repeat-containing protein [Muriicola sp. Z0-33]MCW5515070.1 VCBS repeat-containing protein [Muriicola sp. Z0-33]